jgi:endonuclease III
MNETAIRDLLVKKGKNLFSAPPTSHSFTENDLANKLLNDLDRYPHAFVLACIMDRQIKAEKAWMIPYRFQEKLGNFSMNILAKQSETSIRKLMSKPQPLHRYVEQMSNYFFKGIHHIVNRYNSDASRIWAGKPSSATVVFRFLEFEGVGPKIASMAANLLARDFKIPFSDYFSIDISADIHVRRVFGRLGLTSHNATVNQLIFRARDLSPRFPGLIDFPTWDIGRKWCGPKVKKCYECYMKDLCPSSDLKTKVPRYKS